jgi:hypothetical protein
MTGTRIQPEQGDRADETEQRLRAALHARAQGIGRGDLRSAAPPSAIARTFRPVRRALAVFFGLAAAAACVLLVYAARPAAAPIGPARTPPTSRAPVATGSPSPSPTAPSPQPSPSRSAARTAPGAAKAGTPRSQTGEATGSPDPVATMQASGTPTAVGTP